MGRDGSIVREIEVATCPEALARGLGKIAPAFELVGLEAGPVSEWLVRGLADDGVAAVLMETRQVRAALSSMRTKTDRNDARAKSCGPSRRSRPRPRPGLAIICPGTGFASNHLFNQPMPPR
jgi:hypothetical protein